MNRFSITKVHATINPMKYNGAIEVPHVFPLIQLGAVSIISNITLFQSSPVLILNRISRELLKFQKLVYSSITSPSFTSLNINEPNTANMKNMRARRVVTFKREWRENWIVWRSAYNPS